MSQHRRGVPAVRGPSITVLAKSLGYENPKSLTKVLVDFRQSQLTDQEFLTCSDEKLDDITSECLVQHGQQLWNGQETSSPSYPGDLSVIRKNVRLIYQRQRRNQHDVQVRKQVRNSPGRQSNIPHSEHSVAPHESVRNLCSSVHLVRSIDNPPASDGIPVDPRLLEKDNDLLSDGVQRDSSELWARSEGMPHGSSNQSSTRQDALAISNQSTDMSLPQSEINAGTRPTLPAQYQSVAIQVACESNIATTYTYDGYIQPMQADVKNACAFLTTILDTIEHNRTTARMNARQAMTEHEREVAEVVIEQWKQLSEVVRQEMTRHEFRILGTDTLGAGVQCSASS